MLLERYYDDSLAQASYLIGCEASGEAVVIDPNRDVDQYARAAAARRLRIQFVTETHIHADFLSGARDLARQARATLALSELGGDGWQYAYAGEDHARLLREGDTLVVGNVRLGVLHTPGHTPEHVSFLVTDGAVGDRPMGIASGDFLFVGDVGRPDLLERAAHVVGSMEQAARQLYVSLQRMRSLPDYLQIWPGHGAGSACGKSLGAVPQSTLGYERLYNPAFQFENEDDFVRWVLADQPEPPRYFAVMKQLNRDGPPARPTPAAVGPLALPALEAAVQSGDWVVDVRESADFAKGHLPGTINIPAARTLPTYAGTVLSYDRPIALVAKTGEQALAVTRQLALIGLDRVSGWASADVVRQLERERKPVATVRLIDPLTLADRLATNGPRVIDVRGRSEWNDGHLPNARHIYLGDVVERTADLKRDEPIVVHCETGTRSSVAASLLMARGFRDVSNLFGGFAAWRKAGLPVTQDQS